ncbi:2-keto-4-pentenoate hydratase [Novosphingobium hassiacum]|uniref:2-keto-4-pentenoate hydratase n=1 Tax=Novosphingobium hassiacum TaxID=173676 RepID=A0A7W5ZXG9_9SPHN|nr:2-keto-4-pentenoate hydratase [Novosphingobium hassiacum]MBB3861281.1 2-keto-4-pentenoate hydratase [Novosphingobium hassiacum]
MSAEYESLCNAIVMARRNGQTCVVERVALPADVAQAYAMQAELVAQWGEPVVGWKVGRFLGEEEQRFGVNRFVGPIFAGTVEDVTPAVEAIFPAIEGGTSAFEAEVIAVLAQDLPVGKTDWTAETIGVAISDWHIGIEVAGCPVPGLGTMGALPSVAVFGNNLALLVGPAVSEDQVDAISCETHIDGALAGSARAASLPGGPKTAVAFALNQLSAMGVALKAGTFLSTGAITGVHAVDIGQSCTADFGPHGRLTCKVASVGGTAGQG